MNLSNENWIWLPESKYPQNQTTIYSSSDNHCDGNYTVAEFKKTYVFNKEIKKILIRVSGDTLFRLYANNKVIVTGPPAVGGDFLCNDKARPSFYSFELELYDIGCEIDFFAQVKMMPYHQCEYSKGHGGFMLSGTVYFIDGSSAEISTDSSWFVRKNGAYVSVDTYDGRILPDEYTNAQEIKNIWHTQTAPIPVRTEEKIFSRKYRKITLEPNEEKEVYLEFDKIYSGFFHAKTKTSGILYADAFIKELDEATDAEHIIFSKDDEYRSFIMKSSGGILLKLKNDSDSSSEFEAGFIFTHYPVDCECKTTTSDADLNSVLDTCRHTLKICRQTIHLDSPKHCEPLACTGDYYIETLMTAFSFGDMRLAEFDVFRTAELLKNNNGRLFHTTYSLIWVKMLYDVYKFTGNIDILKNCRTALDMLLARFETYIGENGLIETPPDYMFIDWIYIDGISMHHPPKALGQTCLNMFYYMALDTAAKIYNILSENAIADICTANKEKLKHAVNTLLYDENKGLYFEGLNSPTPSELLYNYMPANIKKRYYLKHSNIMATYSGICGKEKSRELLHKILSDECPGEYQPYFAHYLLEAIYSNGLKNEYTLAVLNKWKEPVLKCSKGLVEGFLPPEPTYSFDHSHAWGGTPLWSLPQALTGLEINKPGFAEITLSPSLLGLESATVEIPTPYGLIICSMKKGEKPVITYPSEIKVNIKVESVN